MDLFEVLMGSGKNREEYQDYANRYEQGPAWEGYSDQEVLDRYDSVAHKVSPREYEQATREAFDRLSPGGTGGIFPLSGGPGQNPEHTNSTPGRPKRQEVRGIWTGFQRLPDKSIRNPAPFVTRWARWARPRKTPPGDWEAFFQVP